MPDPEAHSSVDYVRGSGLSVWHWTAPLTHQQLQPINNIYQTLGGLCSIEYSIESKVPLMEYKIDGICQAIS